MQQDNIDKDSMEQNDRSDKKPGAFKSFEERMDKRRRRASISRLIFYVIALIAVILLMLWLRAKGM